MDGIGQVVFWGTIVLVLLVAINIIFPTPEESAKSSYSKVEKKVAEPKMSRQERKERDFVKRHVDKCGSSLDCLKYASAVWIEYCMNDGARKLNSKEFGIEVCLYALENYCEAALQDNSDQEAVCNLSRKFRAIEKAVSY